MNQGADTGTQYLNVFSNYGDEAHATNNLETNVFREYTVAEADVGTTFTYSFITKRPAADTGCGSANETTLATANLCQAFIKVLNPGNGYAAEPGVYLDTSGVSLTEWEAHSLTVDITAGMVGWPLQFGYSSTGGNYAPTSVLYDNMAVSQDTTPEPEPEPTATDLFISEFGEGALNGENWPKFIEIANFTGADVSLDGYFLGRMSNGINSGANPDEYEASIEFTSGATIANGDVWVIGRADNDDNEAPQTYLDNLDQDNSGISHNGNDAYKLYKKASASDAPSQTATVIDALGDMGDGDGEAGTYWDVCGVSRGMEDVLVARKASAGGTVTTDGLASFGTNADDCQWVVTKVSDFLTQSYDSVGSHTFTGSAE